MPIRVDGVSRIVNTSAAPGARVGTPTTGNPSSIVELEATELLLSQTIQDSQGERVRAIPDMSNEAKNSLKGAHHRSRIYLVIGRVRHHDAPRSRLLTGTVRCRVLSSATIDAAAAARRCAATAVGKAELQAASGRRRGTSGSLGAPSCSAWECAAEVRRVPLSPMRARRRKDRDHDSAGPGRTGFPARFQSARRYHVRIAAKTTR